MLDHILLNTRTCDSYYTVLLWIYRSKIWRVNALWVLITLLTISLKALSRADWHRQCWFHKMLINLDRRRGGGGGPLDRVPIGPLNETSSMRRRLFAGMKSLTGFGSRSRQGSPSHRSISLPESTRFSVYTLLFVVSSSWPSHPNPRTVHSFPTFTIPSNHGAWWSFTSFST